MATLNPIDFVNRALSEDEGRYNMNGAYRDKDRLVGTDGHRLHMVSGLVKQEKPGFVDGRDAQFPNYEMVLPKATTEIATFKFTKREIAHLGKVVKLFRNNYDGCKFEFEPGKPLTISREDKGERDSFTISLSLPLVNVRSRHVVGLNLRYFVEALIPDVVMTFSAADEKGKPQLVEADFSGSKYTAVVMPIRLD